MAKKKNVEEPVVDEQVLEQENPVGTQDLQEDLDVKGEETTEEPVVDEKTELVEDELVKEHEEEVKIEIPEYADKILRCYPNYSALYIDVKGGVYTEDAQLNLVEYAILYQNPYYKS